VFLDINGHRPDGTQDEVFELVVAIAAGELTDVEKIAELLARWS
jgi:hypothetical protein